MFKSWKDRKFKFNNKKIIDDGHKYDSKLEHKYKKYLDILKANGDVTCYLPHIPIPLPGGTKYIADFLVFYSDGMVRFIDVKGVQTDTFKIKKREVEAIYPFEIEIIKKGDF